jgi:hypothetical protein
MADLTGGILACRPRREIDEWLAERGVTTQCQDCQIDVLANQKNLGRGLIILCMACAAKCVAKEGAIVMPAQVIGSQVEDVVIGAAKELEEKLK